MKYWYTIEDYTDDDFDDNEYDGPNDYNHETVAEDVAEEYWASDPTDPNRFEAKVSVKDENGVIKKFTVYAEPTVNFYAKEE